MTNTDWSQLIDPAALRLYGNGLPESDEALMALAQAGMEMIEKYLDRGLALQERTETYPLLPTAALHSWPVKSVASVEKGAGTWPAGCDMEWRLDAQNGVLYMDEMVRHIYVAEIQVMPMVVVTYTAGFGTMPSPICCALSQLCMAMQQAAMNAGQQITQQMIDGYQVTYSSRNASGSALEMLSPAACILLDGFANRKTYR